MFKPPCEISNIITILDLLLTLIILIDIVIKPISNNI